MNMPMQLRPFTVPNFVIVELPQPPKESAQSCPSLSIEDLDEQTLSGLCDEFRANVFARAGKQDPKLP